MRLRGGRRRLLRALLIAGALLALSVGVTYTQTNKYYWPRIMFWMGADVGDIGRFPSRVVTTAPPPFIYPAATDPAIASRLETVTFEGDGKREPRPLDSFMSSTGAAAFIVIHRDQLVYEKYYNGYDRDSTVTSFSVAKSFVSALVGVAIKEGYIKSVDDPITNYIPELLERDERFGRITVRHLLSMSSGLRYVEGGSPLSDDSKTYYAPNMRKLALTAQVEGEPGQNFEYNNYHPLLLGLILERTTGRPVAQYLTENIWQPLGMEANGSWSLDSAASGFEKMESGINGRAIDFAKFGSLYLHGGEWRGRQVVPQEWVEESTRPDTTTDPARDYQHFWWVGDPEGENRHYSARGNHGQFIFVFPEKDLVIVRFGAKFGYDGWVKTFEELASRFEP